MGPGDGELTNGVIMSSNRAEPRLRVSRVEMPGGGALENEISLVLWFLVLGLERGEGSAGMKGPSVHPTLDKSRQLCLSFSIFWSSDGVAWPCSTIHNYTFFFFATNSFLTFGYPAAYSSSVTRNRKRTKGGCDQIGGDPE